MGEGEPVEDPVPAVGDAEGRLVVAGGLLVVGEGEEVLAHGGVALLPRPTSLKRKKNAGFFFCKLS